MVRSNVPRNYSRNRALARGQGRGLAYAYMYIRTCTCSVMVYSYFVFTTHCELHLEVEFMISNELQCAVYSRGSSAVPPAHGARRQSNLSVPRRGWSRISAELQQAAVQTPTHHLRGGQWKRGEELAHCAISKQPLPRG